MQSMVEELIGNEEVMLAIARASGNHIEGYDDIAGANEEKSAAAGGESSEAEEDEDDDYRRYKEYMDSKT